MLAALDDDKPADLPDALILNYPHLSVILWHKLRAIDWKWTPSQLMAEDDALIEDILALESNYRMIERQEYERKRQEQEQGEG